MRSEGEQAEGRAIRLYPLLEHRALVFGGRILSGLALQRLLLTPRFLYLPQKLRLTYICLV